MLPKTAKPLYTNGSEGSWEPQITSEEAKFIGKMEGEAHMRRLDEHVTLAAARCYNPYGGQGVFKELSKCFAVKVVVAAAAKLYSW